MTTPTKASLKSDATQAKIVERLRVSSIPFPSFGLASLTNNVRARADSTSIVETGEEGEETIFSGQAKLYHLVRGDTPADSGWKERGAGVLKVKVRVAPAEESLEPTEDDGDEVSPDAAVTESVHRTARLLMRASGVYRVVLNSPIYKGMNLRTPAGSVPSLEKPSKQLMLTIIEDGKPVMMQVKVSLKPHTIHNYIS